MNIPDAPAKSARSIWKAVLLLLLVFLFGAAAGVGGSLLFLRSQIRNAITRSVSQHDRLDKLAIRIESRMSDSLKLNAEERNAVHEELAVSTRRARVLRLRMIRDFRTLTADTLARISKRLPAEKQAKLNESASARLKLWGLEPRLDEEPSE